MEDISSEPLCPSAEELQEALAFEPQYINPIAIRLHKQWPDWPRPPLNREAFYRSLRDTILDPSRYIVLRQLLHDIAARKGKDWRLKTQLLQRVFNQADRTFKQLDEDGWSDARKHFPGGDAAAVGKWMKEHFTCPECAPYLKVFGWLTALDSATSVSVPETENAPMSINNGDLAQQADLPMQAHWDQCITNLIKALDDKATQRFSRDLIQFLLNETGNLSHIADTHDRLMQTRQSTVLQHLNSLLDDAAALSPVGDSALRADIAQIRDQLQLPGPYARLDRLESNCNAISARIAEINSLRNTQQELENRLENANELKDYDAIIAAAQALRSQKALVAEATTRLTELFADIVRTIAILDESPKLSMAPATDTQESSPTSAKQAAPFIVESATSTTQIIQEPNRPFDSTSGGMNSSNKPEQLATPTDLIDSDDNTELTAASATLSDAFRAAPSIRTAEAAVEPSELEVGSHARGPTSPAFPPDTSAAQLINAYCSDPTRATDAATALVWVLVRDSHLALAYQLARAQENVTSHVLAPLDANAFLALFLAQQIHGPADEVAEPLRDALTSLLVIDFLNDKAVRHRRANGLIAYAAALRPALLAPSLTGARAVLEERHLPLDFASLHDLRTAIIDSSRLGLSLNEATLKGRAGPGTWEHNLAELCKRSRDWWDEHRNRRLRYAPTAKVWQHWLEDNGPIGALLKAVAEDRHEYIDLAQREIDVWRNSRDVYQKLDLTDQDLRGRNAKLRPIDGSPRRDIARLAAEAMDFVQQWLALHATRPGTDYGADSRDLSDWVQRTHSLLLKAKEDLGAVLGAAKDLPDLAAIRAVLSALEDLGYLLDPEVPIRRGLPWWKLLGLPLLLDPDIQLDDQWQPVEGMPSAELLHRIVPLATKTNDWFVAFSKAQERCAHGATGRIVEALGASDTPPTELESLRHQRDESFEYCRRRLNERVREIAGAVSHAVDSGYLDEEDRAKIGEQLESCKDRQDGDIGFGLRVLDSIEDELREHKQARIKEERERLHHNESLSGKPELRARIERLLERGELATAAEYVTHAENHEDPPSDDRITPLGSEFFPGFLAQAAEQLAGSKGGEILRALESGRTIGPLTPPIADAERSLILLRDWLKLQGHRLPDQDAVGNFVRTLGFRASRVEIDSSESGTQRVFGLDTDPLQDRSVCIVPQFGSLARGHYRLVCIWDRIPAEELRKNLGRRGGAPTLVLYLNRMPENQRRELAYQCRQNRQTFLVLDEWLLYFLINREPATRLATLFQCAFQFTVVNPYTPTSSDVPDEIFFGRRRAMDQIADLHGSNLVYGGRQLGKTALLREVKRRYHTPQHGFYVFWIDLKYEGIGVGRPLEEVWAMIGSELTKEGLLSNRISRAESVQREIASWLNADDCRRLLILLDEADELFAQDARVEYKTLMGLKNLMERTSRRFKVVFAGLHNVQRMSRDVNSPVKHLSKPICVGPLLEDGESREAFRLVSMPLRMLGYQCADDVVNTVLSYTNYYPNLIQHFCHSLLENLNQDRFDAQTTPPYEITAEHVEQAYQRRDLRQFIRDRFQITLDLDPRYRVLALRIALETLERRKSGEETASGFTVEWVREEALRLWQRGFNDRSSEAFRTLLDEMIGLGLLRHAQRGYALRSPNIVNLLGAHDAIQQDLLDACEKEPPPVYTAATYRRALGDDQWQRSPLVAEQEYEILAPENGIVLLFGTVIAGVDRTLSAIMSAAERVPEAQLLPLQDLVDPHDLEKRLRAALDKQKAENLVVIIDPRVPWSEAWVRDADQVLRHRRSKRSTARIVLIGNATAAWSWSGRSESEQEYIGVPRIMTLKPWAPEALRQWQRDTGIGPLAEADLEGITKATGLWDQPLFLLGGQLRNDLGNWRETFKDVEQRIGANQIALYETLNYAPGAQTLLTVLTECEEALSATDIVDLSDFTNVPEVRRLLSWADLLAFIRPEGQGRWRIDPFIAHLMRDGGA